MTVIEAGAASLSVAPAGWTIRKRWPSAVTSLEKSGSWFSYAGDRLGQGRENAKQFLKENPDIRQIVEDRVRKELGPVREPEVAAV